MSDFGHALLGAIQEAARADDYRDRVLMEKLEKIVKKALGIREEKIFEPHFFQQPVKGEFPQWRVRYDPLTRKEIDRRVIRDMGELQELSREFGGLFHEVDSYTPVPPREG